MSSTLSVQLPSSLHKQLQVLADKEGFSLDQFVALAIAEKISALVAEDYLQKRADRGSRGKYESVLAKVPDCVPDTQDSLPLESA